MSDMMIEFLLIYEELPEEDKDIIDDFLSNVLQGSKLSLDQIRPKTQ